MAKVGSSGFSVLAIDGVNLLPAKVQTFVYRLEIPLEKTDGLGDRWEEHTPTGMRRAVITQSGAYFDTAIGGMHAALKAAPLTPRILIFAMAGVGPGGELTRASGTIQTAYEVLAQNAHLTKANVEYQVSGAVETGIVVAGGDGDHLVTWNTTATPADLAAPVSGPGLGAYQSVSVLEGTTFSGVLRDSPDGVAWSVLATFTPRTTAGAETIALPGGIKRYVSFTGTLAGAGRVRVVAGVFPTTP